MAKLLNNGYVNLVESMGHDQAAIRNARRCWRSESKGEGADTKLIQHLLRAGHKTPFEAMVFTFDVKTPLFVARQWFRHRMGSYNEESLRYCVALKDYYIPEGLEGQALTLWKAHNDQAFAVYEQLVSQHGLQKEQARSVLPVGLYTKFYWTVNGSALMNFLALRLDSHAQQEIRCYAQAILDIVILQAPISFTAFKEVMAFADRS